MKFGLMSVVVVSGVMLSGFVAAEDTTDGAVNLGYAASSGNSDAESLAFDAELNATRAKWTHKLTAKTFTSSQDDSTSAEKYSAAYQANYALSDRHSTFARTEYDDDRFSGYDYQVSVTAGWASDWQLSEPQSLTTELGLGFRQSEFSAGGSEDEAIIRVALAYATELSETTTFKQTLSSDIGEETTVSKAGSSLTVSMSERLALKLSLDFKHYSEPVAGADSLDRETTVSLNYNF